MLSILYDELLYHIISFLFNEDIFKLNKISKKFNILTKNINFIEYIYYRDHPLVFNKFDTYCNLCNLGIYLIDENIKFIKCNH